MNQQEIYEALAAQEEHIKRSTSCRGIIGQAHAYRTHGNPLTGQAFEACITCGVKK